MDRDMTSEVSPEKLANEIRQIYRSKPSEAHVLIEARLGKGMDGFLPVERLAVLEEVSARFDVAGPGTLSDADLEADVNTRVFSLLLGKKVSQADLSSTELLKRLAVSLNTIFDTLNELVRVINMTLMGGSSEDETIRQVLIVNMEGESGSQSLKGYLDQIKNAFLITERAFKETARSKMRDVLFELDPDRIIVKGGGMKFGPLRKAEQFETYREKFHTCKKWFDSGRFMGDFLREFEKNCQKATVE